MKPYIDDPDFRLLNGDALEMLRTLPSESVHCALTSPPFFGLRNYDCEGQIGLEATPEEWVARLVEVFREVRRVLRRDGTLWVEIGDSYSSSPAGNKGERRIGDGGEIRSNTFTDTSALQRSGIKPKDLLGQPFLLAFAMRQPYYTGTIKDERDRLWLAAMIDTEGTIAINKNAAREAETSRDSRKIDYFGPYLKVYNTSKAIIDRCASISGVGSVKVHDDRGRTVYVWAVYGKTACDVLQEVYPHLVAKQHEARVTFAGRTLEAYEAMRILHRGEVPDFNPPAPPTLWEPGWYWRDCIIWNRPNPMPESVRDRTTKAHSYVLMFSKVPRYFFDQDAISEPAQWQRWGDQTVPKYEGTDTATGWMKPKTKAELQGLNGRNVQETNSEAERRNVVGGTFNNNPNLRGGNGSKNARSVWNIPTQGFPGAHFATWPEALVERIILAGTSERGCCPECGAPWERETEVAYTNPGNRRTNGPRSVEARDDPMRGTINSRGSRLERQTSTTGWRPTCEHGRPDTVPAVCLDVFMGSGTTALVARRLGRRSVGIELNPDYARMAAERLQQLSLLA